MDFCAFYTQGRRQAKSRPMPRRWHIGIQGGSIRSKRGVIADRVWAGKSSSQSSRREPGAAGESYGRSNGHGGRGGSSFNDDLLLSELKAEMARTTRCTDAEAGG
jgi:hypothetical protein